MRSSPMTAEGRHITGVGRSGATWPDTGHTSLTAIPCNDWRAEGSGQSGCEQFLRECHGFSSRSGLDGGANGRVASSCPYGYGIWVLTTRRAGLGRLVSPSLSIEGGGMNGASFAPFAGRG